MDDLFIIILFGGILLSPVVIPALKKKWISFWVALAGYGLYILWGVYLYFTKDIQDYGTGYGMFIVPYVILVAIVSTYIQKGADQKD